MRRSPLSALVLQGALSIPGNSRPVSVPLVQRHFPPSTGERALPSRGFLAPLPLSSTHLSVGREASEAEGLLSPPQPAQHRRTSAPSLAFPPQADHLRPPPLHRRRLCVLSARHFACGTLRPISALPGSSNTGPRLLCSGGCPDPPPSHPSSG
ncbi:hypothetical protein NDU88_001901 [Pleurodeles waltl]|uniref:Uncharacterized protein n=1 Tax=Pleurodeles waltl TaxID=8319 RepID=A0AAV7UXE7_PLEWA|nr:hypothetical protein NDU88_001901 [Pleurodeles waltl]